MIIAVTGHRPQSLGGFTANVLSNLQSFTHRVIALAAERHSDLTIITGMALGWDQAIASSCIHYDVPFKAYVPFEGQELAWIPESQEHYHNILAYAQDVRICCPGNYSSFKMQLRNECMVNDCNKLIALHNGQRGGTNNCVKYARSQNVEIVNLWNEWLNHIGFKGPIDVEHEFLEK